MVSIKQNNSEPKKTSPGVYIFYGEDNFSLRKKIEFWKTEFVKKYSNQGLVLIDSENLTDREIVDKIKEAASPSLFSARKLVIIKNALPAKTTQEFLAENILEIIAKVSADILLVFWQDQKPDGRLSFTKKLLKSGANVSEFKLPHGRELDVWIKTQVKILGTEITDKGASKLAEYAGRDLFLEKKFSGKVIELKEAYDLWQVYSELLKLSSYSAAIDEKTVELLVKPKLSDSAFDLTDEISNNNKIKAFAILENLLGNSTTEEKIAVIKILGLLAEQVRSLILVKLCLQEKMNPGEVAGKLGWSSGRVFVVSKHAQKIPLEKLKKLLNKLLALDLSLKSSETNPRLLMDLFINAAIENSPR